MQAEQLGLPIPKHKCWDRPVASDGPVSNFYGSHVGTKGKKKGLAMDDRLEPESIKDSNSFAEDSDSATSAYTGDKTEAEYAKILPASSSQSCGIDSLENANSPLDGLNVVKGKADSSEEELAIARQGHYSSQHQKRMQAYMYLEEQLLEFENHGDYITSEYGDESLEQCNDKEFEDILYANGLNSNVYILSSGRWSVNQGNFGFCRKILCLSLRVKRTIF